MITGYLDREPRKLGFAGGNGLLSTNTTAPAFLRLPAAPLSLQLMVTAAADCFLFSTGGEINTACGVWVDSTGGGYRVGVATETRQWIAAFATARTDDDCIGLVWDTQKLDLYVNGVLRASNSAPTVVSKTVTTAFAFGRSANNALKLTGQLCEFSCWEAAKTHDYMAWAAKRRFATLEPGHFYLPMDRIINNAVPWVGNVLPAVPLAAAPSGVTLLNSEPLFKTD